MMRTIIILIFIVFPGMLFSQENKTMDSKNALTFDCADILFTGNCAFNYERHIYSNQSYRSMIAIGFGGWYSFNNNGDASLNYLASSYSVPITFNIIKGTGKHHLECDFGVRLLMDKRWSRFQDNGVVEDPPQFDNSIVKPLFNIGYRYQKSNGRFIFRTFIGLGGIGFGFGRAF